MELQFNMKRFDLTNMVHLNGNLVLRGENTPIFPPSVAYAMTSLAINPGEPTAVFDPFSGAGTILTTGGLSFPNVVDLHGSDLDSEAVLATQMNLETAFGNDNYSLNITQGDALSREFPKPSYPLAIITDPPFGRKCSWKNSKGDPSDSPLLDQFLARVRDENPARFVFCYDGKEDHSQTVKRYFGSVQRNDIKGRAIYSTN